MPNAKNGPLESTVIMDSDTLNAAVQRIAREIIDGNAHIESLVILGILRGGLPIARRFAKLIGEITGIAPPVGALATTLYRDDVHRGTGMPSGRGETHFDFNVDGRTVLLVDDVLAAGRTIRAAMDEVMDYGRPQRIQLACLVDRGGRELPIRADYLGWPVSAEPNEWVSVRLGENGEDYVLLERYAAPSTGEGA